MKLELGNNRTLDRSAWRRLMGVREEHLKMAESDEKMRAALARLDAQMDEAEELLFDTAVPAFTYELVDAGILQIQGESLRKHLEGCDRMAVMAVTLGHAVDDLISETQASRIALGVVVDSGASVMAERAAELAEAQIRTELAANADHSASGAPAAPLYMTPRFSPGYGDSPLQMQQRVLGLLDAEQKLGITLSKGFMMSPSKSITAILGLADHPVTGRLATCAECVLREKCALRKEGKRCGASR